MTRPTIIRAPILPMAGKTPTHAQGFHLADFFHIFNFAVANDTIKAFFNMTLMGELNMRWQVMNIVPGHRLFLSPILGQLDDFRTIGRYIFVAFHAHGNGWYSWLSRYFDISVAMGALQSHKRNMPLMTESNWLVRCFAICFPEISQKQNNQNQKSKIATNQN